MKRRNHSNHHILLAALLPGVGHIVLGKRSRGIPLLVFTLIMILVLYGRWQVFVNAFSSTRIDHWLAAAHIASAAGTARYMRSRLLEVLNEEYVLAARARGLKERAVILKHALRNALIPIVTIFGLSLPFLLGGAVIIENIFAWPGMGRLAVLAIHARDYPVILATTMIAAVLTVIGNLVADVTYAVVDPRVSYEKKKPV